MNTFDLDHQPSRPWTATGVAGLLATTAVTVLLSATASVTAHAVPVTWQPAGPEPLATITQPRPAEQTVPCFMGRHSWSTAAVGPIPRCVPSARTDVAGTTTTAGTMTPYAFAGRSSLLAV